MWYAYAQMALLPADYILVILTYSFEMAAIWYFSLVYCDPWFPLGLEIRENLEKWEGIFQSGKSQGILSRLEKSGNFAQNTGKTGKFE